MSDIKKIEEFISLHHVLTLSTSKDNTPYSSSAFYAYDNNTKTFIIASEEKTTHIQHILLNPIVSLNIHLETTKIGKIQGLQIKAKAKKLEDKTLKNIYFKAFPYALTLNPTLWQIKPFWFKYTDNRLGFGKKIILEL